MSLDLSYRWIDSKFNHMCEQILHWASVNTHAFNLEGLKQFQSILVDQFKSCDPEIKLIPLKPFEYIDDTGQWHKKPLGSILIFRKRMHLSNRVLLVGHMDTAFPKDHPFRKAEIISPQKMQGPGVCDMKGGLAVMLNALTAFEKLPWAKDLGWEIIITPDEEIGSPSSSAYVEEIAMNHNLALVFEPALDAQGTLASARKGSGKFSLVVKGRSAHVGRNFKEGKSAIIALIDLSKKIHKLNKIRDSIIVNVGYIKGGDVPNRVPHKAFALLDVRIETEEDKQWFHEQLLSLVNNVNMKKGIHVSLHGGFKRPPKIFDTKSEKLYEQVKALAANLSQPLEWKPTGGCCDGNNIAKTGCKVIDTLGVCGENTHTDSEFIKLDSVVDRCKLTCLILSSLAKRELTL